MSYCRSCDAPVFWVRTETDRSMPLDVEPRDDGNLALEPCPDGEIRAVPFSPLLHPTQLRYVSHFATCPQAREWRR